MSRLKWDVTTTRLDPQGSAGDSSSPAIIRRLVVLLQPDGPTRTMNSPSPIPVQILHGVEIAGDLGRLRTSRSPWQTSPTDRPSRAHASCRRSGRGRAPYGAGSGSPHRTAADTEAQGKRQARPRARSISRPRTRSPSARRPLWTNSVVIHGRPADRGHGLFGERLFDVEVVDVDGRRRDLVDGQLLLVEQPWPPCWAKSRRRPCAA
jgi:hypothetical protein